MRNKISILIVLTINTFILSYAQDSVWDLNRCITYALEQNLQLQNARISKEELKINTKLAKGQWQPSLSFSTSHGVTNSPWRESEITNNTSNTSYNGNYSLGASWTVFNGFKRKYNIKQQELQEEIQSTSIKTSEEDLKITVLNYYIQILYALENVKIRQNSLEVAQAELDRQKSLLEAGSISKVDFSQIEAQYVTEQYQLVESENDLRNKSLNLKQLLRLDLNDEIEIYLPTISDDIVLQPIPSKDEILQYALENRPELQNARLNQQMSDLKIKSAKSGYYPSINLNAGVSSGHNSSSTVEVGKQMKQNFGENVGISLGYSIFDNRNRKSAVEIAKLGAQKSNLETEQIKDNLKIFIETAYMDAIAAQLSYQASLSKEKAVQESYNLMKEKYSLGMKNPFEMLSEKNSLLSTQVQTIQSKYTAILNILILQIYQGYPINL